jgi:hypothetical protein
MPARGLRIDDRADPGLGIGGGADVQIGHGRREALRELLHDLFMDVEPVRRRACLASVPELRQQGPRHGTVQVGVLGHDERRVPSELHRGVDHAIGRLSKQDPADVGRSGERDLADAWILQPLGHYCRCVKAGHGVDNAVRDTGLDEESRDRKRRQRSLRRGLQHCGATRGQGRGELPRDHGSGEGPGRHERGDTNRPMGDDGPRPAARRLAVTAIAPNGLLREPLDPAAGDEETGAWVQRVDVLVHRFGEVHRRPFWRSAAVAACQIRGLARAKESRRRPRRTTGSRPG